MGFTWNKESAPTWNADKQRIIGGAPVGAFDLDYIDGQALPSEWWAVTDDAGKIVGYGWLDINWGDAEILLATDSDAQGRGVGSFILDHIEDEAAARGVNYVYNTIRTEHPDRENLHNWLDSHGFRGSDTDESLRKRVGGRAAETAAVPGSGPAFDDKVDMGPGREDEGGYVDPEKHRY